MKFSKEEKRLIRENIKLLVKDMRELWEIFPYEKIKIPVGIYIDGYSPDWDLVIDKSKIELVCDDGYIKSNSTSLERVPGIGDVYVYGKDEYLAHHQFIKKYDEIREELKHIVEKRAQTRKDSLEMLNAYNKKYKKQDIVEVSVPESKNPDLIEIKNEDGKNVGIIDFGDKSIKIITSGDIVLVNKEKETAKHKRM